MTVQPGDVICTRNPKGWPARMIRLGAAFLDRPNGVNHVIVAHHRDDAGTFWGIEGRPGGVGWVAGVQRIADQPYSRDNHTQPKTETQRTAVCKAAEVLLGTPYDWAGIALDGIEAFNLPIWWRPTWDGTVPAHVVCSSLADWTYERAGLASPQPDRDCTPGDWAAFIEEKGWEA